MSGKFVPIMRRDIFERRLSLASERLAAVTGQDRGLWKRILRWRARHFQRDDKSFDVAAAWAVKRVV